MEDRLQLGLPFAIPALCPARLLHLHESSPSARTSAGGGAGPVDE
jgi:hypothetical protein